MVVHPLIEIYTFVVFISVVLSWLVSFNVVNTSNQLVGLIWRITGQLTEPAFRFIRRFIPPFGGMDFSPIFLILGLYFLNGAILPRLFSLLAFGDANAYLGG